MNFSVYPQPRGVWFKVLGLAALQGVIGLCWLIYNLYLPKLLVELGFPAQFGLSLLVIENLLAIGLEPLMGSLSDRSRHWLGSRLPLITLGIGLSAALFLLLPVSLLWGLEESWRWVLAGLAVVWAIAMTIFRSPALSLLGSLVFKSQLPQAASLLTLMTALVGVVNLTASQIILSWGAKVAFAVGSGALLLVAVVLHWLKVESRGPGAKFTLQLTPWRWQHLIPVFGVGIGSGAGGRMLISLLQAAPAVIWAIPALGVFTLAHLLTILPAGQQASRWGNRRAMVVGVVLLCLALPLLAGQVWLTLAVVLLAIGFSLNANGALPFALTCVPAQKAGLGTGVFFGGVALANSALGSLGGQVANLAMPLQALIAGLCFLLVGLCVSWTKVQKI